MKALIKATPRLLAKHCSSSQFRVGDWVFQLGPEGWRFAEVYAED